jgi:hypothetical protein
MIQCQHPWTGILEEYPRDRLRTRDHFTLPSKAYLHTIIIIVIIKIMLLVAEKLSHLTCCLLLLLMMLLTLLLTCCYLHFRGFLFWGANFQSNGEFYFYFFQIGENSSVF